MAPKIRLTGRKILDVYARKGRTRDAFTITAGNQRVPPGESSRTFAGYPTIFHALTAASQINRIGLIVQFFGQPRGTAKITGAHGINLLGAFHVFDSDQNKHRIQPNYEAISAAPRDLTILALRATNMVKPASSKSWAERLMGARDPEDYTHLIKDFMGLEQQELNIEHNSNNYRTAVINFNPLLSRAGGEGGIINLPCVRNEGPLPEPTLAIGPKAYYRSLPIYTMMTIVHEATHVVQAVRSLALLRLWRETAVPDFSNWLQSLWDSREISFVDFQVAEEHCKGGSSTMQLLAALEGVTIGYHHVPRSGLGKDGVIWHQLWVISQFWGPVHVDIKAHVLHRLSKYYSGLDRDHRDALSAQLRVRKERGDAFSIDLLAHLEAAGRTDF